MTRLAQSPRVALFSTFWALILVRTAFTVPERATERVVLRADDGVSLTGTWHEPSLRPAPAVILVHMLQKSRHDWEVLAARLADEGIGALTFDLRGHGDSQGRSTDLAAMVQDVRAARRFLASRREVMGGRIGIAGASIGANLAALAAADDPAIVGLVLLSPSLDYRGLRIEAAIRKYGARAALLVASDDDPYAARSVRELQKAGGGTPESLVLSRAGHGTTMLIRDPFLSRALFDWFKRTFL
jgi:alpha-beta hydrolase superfamily lysophospholipase